MSERKYEVLMNDTIVAQEMDIRTAMILVRALFEEYYKDHTMIVSIKEMERTECV